MNVRHIFICFFSLSLWDRNTGLISAEILKRTGTEGENITVLCSFMFSGKRKIFCKDECEEEDILIDTTEVTAQKGRYSIEYIEGTFPVYDTLLYVSITKLTKSDAGRYKCGLARSFSLSSPSYWELEISVNDATTTKPNWTLRPLSTSVSSSSTLMTTQSFSSTLSSASPENTEQPHQLQTAPAAPLLFVGLTLVVMFIVLSVAVVILCRKRASKPKEPPVGTEYAYVTEANRVYEEIREDRHSSSPPVETSTVYSYAKYSKPDGVETSDEYSLVTAVSPQKKTDDDSRKLTYSEVDFSKGASASLRSAPCGDAENVVYSVPRVEASSDGSHGVDASPPLYSTVTLHQM